MQEAPIVQQVPKMTPREHPVSSATLSIQNLTQIETLNRCLIAAITILLLSSGLQRMNEAIRGRKDVSEELVALNDRHTLIKRGKITPREPDTSLWETFFWWIGDDDDDDDDDEGKSKRAIPGRVSRGLRHRALPNRRLLKKRETKFTERRRRRREVDEIKEKLTKEKDRNVKKKVKEVEEEEEDIEKMKKPKKSAKESTQKENQ